MSHRLWRNGLRVCRFLERWPLQLRFCLIRLFCYRLCWGLCLGSSRLHIVAGIGSGRLSCKQEGHFQAPDSSLQSTSVAALCGLIVSKSWNISQAMQGCRRLVPGLLCSSRGVACCGAGDAFSGTPFDTFPCGMPFWGRLSLDCPCGLSHFFFCQLPFLPACLWPALLVAPCWRCLPAALEDSKRYTPCQH